MHFLWSLLALPLAAAQFPPTPQGITTKQVASYPGVEISWKETHICETAAKAWAGYVHMPSSYLEDVETPSDPYNISMFFWYFEARSNPENAPTTIYLSGGPGESSMTGAVQDGGPCYIHSDSNSTFPNPWSMNNEANVLYIDQPVGAGFSYNELLKSTKNLMFLNDFKQTDITPFEAYGGKVPPANTTFLHGLLPSQDPLQTANTTGNAARTLWRFSQMWFDSFPKWCTSDKRVSIWGNSYAGYFITATGGYIQQQNVKIQNGEINGTVIQLDTIGSLNGCIDALYMSEAYITLAYNNTYDLQMINKTTYEAALHEWNKPEGCKAHIMECRAIEAELDPDQRGNSNKVNKACLAAFEFCLPLIGLNGPSGRDAFDIGHKLPEPFPPSYSDGFLNREWVQQALGVPVNYTSNSYLVNNLMLSVTADIIARAGMKDVEYLLDSGVKIALVYGDRDYRCPWLAAENLALQANWTGAEAFRASGYENVQVNSSYIGGVVRQYGNLSFTRVFESGHDVALYQPETVNRIYNRAIFNKDIASGTISTSGEGNNYTTTGPQSSWYIKNKLPAIPPVACYLTEISSTCSENQYKALQEGTAAIDEGLNVISPKGNFNPVGGTGGGSLG